MRIIVASTNPVKINAVQRAFAAMFPEETFEVQGESVSSNVPAQPMGDETLQGAINRVEQAAQLHPTADYCIGIEGGTHDTSKGMEQLAWMVVRRRDGMMGKARSGTFFLPESVAQLLRSGMELDDADAHVFGRANAGKTNGTVGLLTDDRIDRTAYYEHALILALIPFKHPSHYPHE